MFQCLVSKSKFGFIKLRHYDEEKCKWDRYSRDCQIPAKTLKKQRWVYHNLKNQLFCVDFAKTIYYQWCFGKPNLLTINQF